MDPTRVDRASMEKKNESILRTTAIYRFLLELHDLTVWAPDFTEAETRSRMRNIA